MAPKNAPAQGGTSAAHLSTGQLVTSHKSVVWVGRAQDRSLIDASFRGRHRITQSVMNSIVSGGRIMYFGSQKESFSFAKCMTEKGYPTE